MFDKFSLGFQNISKISPELMASIVVIPPTGWFENLFAAPGVVEVVGAVFKVLGTPSDHGSWAVGHLPPVFGAL